MTAENGVERITVIVNMVMVVIFLGEERPLMRLRFMKRLLMWLPKSCVLFALSYAFLLSVFLYLCFILHIFKRFKNNLMMLSSVDCHLQHLTVTLPFHRPQPYGAAI